MSTNITKKFAVNPLLDQRPYTRNLKRESDEHFCAFFNSYNSTWSPGTNWFNTTSSDPESAIMEKRDPNQGWGSTLYAKGRIC